jgi:N-acetylglucosamine kinase-like BadF-type ATPase
VKVVAGLDVGGTKVAVRVEALGGERIADGQEAATDWEPEPAAVAASWLMDRLRPFVPAGSEIAALGVGAQGCDAPEIAAGLRRALGSLGLRAVVVNDGQLLVPAAGFDHGIGIVAGTGSIGVGADAAGSTLLAGGWGAVIGDEGGAAAIVREATRAALAAHDEGLADDGLLTALLRAFDVPNAERLARVVNDDPTLANWGPRASAVFAAADDGSALAASVIDEAAWQLTTLVSRLIARGAVGDTVVAAGSVIVRQPRLAGAFGASLATRHPDLTLHILDAAPVTGAVILARRLLARACPRSDINATTMPS